MRALAIRVWHEPAAFLGLLATIALTVGAWIAGADWTWETIVAVLAPLLTSLGIRQLVVPAREVTAEPAGTRLVRPDERP